MKKQDGFGQGEILTLINTHNRFRLEAGWRQPEVLGIRDEENMSLA